MDEKLKPLAAAEYSGSAKLPRSRAHMQVVLNEAFVVSRITRRASQYRIKNKLVYYFLFIQRFDLICFFIVASIHYRIAGTY